MSLPAHTCPICLVCVCLFRYFRHENKYGLACLARAELMNDDDGSALSVIDQSQRGMRIKSVGILTSSILHIQSYTPYLQAEARSLISYHHSH